MRVSQRIRAGGDPVQRITPIKIIDAVRQGEVYAIDFIADDSAAGEPESYLDFMMRRADSIIDTVTLSPMPLPSSQREPRATE